MSGRTRERLSELLENIYEETHENNLMLRQICHAINVHHARYHQENEEDFARNVLANLLSGGIDIKGILRRKL